MTKAPNKTDSRAKALAGMTKPELVKTIKALDRKQTTLLNRIATLEEPARVAADAIEEGPIPRMPWEMDQ